MKVSLKKVVKTLGVCLTTLLVATGCLSYKHNFPEKTEFIDGSSAVAPTVEFFADANGTFYPSRWQEFMSPKSWWRAHSLMQESRNNTKFRLTIESDEERQLRDFRSFAKDKRRMFVYVHGYNTSYATASLNYDMLDQKIGLREGDAVVRFFWDGLVSPNKPGSGKIWFNAAGYSQMSGSRGLRRILSQIRDTKIYIIGHSRGASVILSALSNPVYDPDFLAATEAVAERWGSAYKNITRPAPLMDNQNQIHILVMAPAVDRIDFCDASQQPEEGGRYECPVLKDLGSQVKTFRYTVNPLDPTLDKLVGLSGSFNPTGLGVDDCVGLRLQSEKYSFMTAYHLDGDTEFHRWEDYIAHETFSSMLRDSGLE